MGEPIVQIEELLAHLNITVEGGGLGNEVPYLQSLLMTAQAVVSEQVCRDLATLSDSHRELARHAVLLLAGEYYMQREDVVVGAAVNNISHGVDRLCALIRDYSK